MPTLSEAYTLDLSDPSFVLLSYSARMQTMAGFSDQHKTMWFERQNACWLADAITRCIATEDQGDFTTTSGHDQLTVLEAGPGADPYLHIRNDRAAEARHGGYQSVIMTRAYATKLAGELARL